MSKAKLRRGGGGRFLSLRYWMLRSPAWKSLPGMARALYLELAERYNGSNNGRISYAVREGTEALHISKSTAKQLLDILIDRGFIVRTKRGAFSLKTTREASEWMLTEYDCDAPFQHATKDFMRWAPPETEINNNNNLKSKTRFAHSTRTVRPAYPYGSATVPVVPKNGPDGSATVPVEAQNQTLTVRPEVHLQLPGSGGAGGRSALPNSAVASPLACPDDEKTNSGVFCKPKIGRPLSTLRLRTAEVLADSDVPLSITEIAARTGADPRDVTPLLGNMLKAGEVVRPRRAHYAAARSA
jgi:DNA-binding MarR family transcriptional regulator